MGTMRGCGSPIREEAVAILSVGHGMPWAKGCLVTRYLGQFNKVSQVSFVRSRPEEQSDHESGKTAKSAIVRVDLTVSSPGEVDPRHRGHAVREQSVSRTIFDRLGILCGKPPT